MHRVFFHNTELGEFNSGPAVSTCCQSVRSAVILMHNFEKRAHDHI